MRRFLQALILAAAASVAMPSSLRAQQAAPSFSPTGQATLSVSNSSTRVVFGSAGPTALIINTGSNSAYLKFGGSTVTATSSNYLLAAGCAMAWDVNGQGYVAAITASSTTTLSIITGGGIPTLPNSACAQTLSGTVTVSGTVTANQGTAGSAAWPVKIDQTTPGTTNGVQTLSGSVSSVSPSQRTIVTLDIKTVTTGGTAVTAIAAGHRTAGGFLQNPKGASVDLCINEIGTAAGTTSSGDTTCIQAGQSYTVAPASTGVSVITSDSSHPFSGYGMN